MREYMYRKLQDILALNTRIIHSAADVFFKATDRKADPAEPGTNNTESRQASE